MNRRKTYIAVAVVAMLVVGVLVAGYGHRAGWWSSLWGGGVAQDMIEPREFTDNDALTEHERLRSNLPDAAQGEDTRAHYRSLMRLSAQLGKCNEAYEALLSAERAGEPAAPGAPLSLIDCYILHDSDNQQAVDALFAEANRRIRAAPEADRPYHREQYELQEAAWRDRN